MGGRARRRPAPPTYALRPAAPADRELLYRIKSDALAPYAVATWGPWDDALQRRRFERGFDHGRFQLVMVGGEVIGLLETSREPDHVVIRNVALVEGWRNRGVGSALLRELARQTPLEIRLHVLKVNPARRFYERLGFRVTGDPEEYWWEMARPPG